MSIFTHVELLAQSFAHFVNFSNRFGVLHVGFLCVLETDGAKDLELFLHALIVDCFLFLCQVKGLAVLTVSDPLNWGQSFFKTLHMVTVMLDAAKNLDNRNSDLNRDRVCCLILELSCAKCFLFVLLEFFDKLINTHLCLLALSHLTAETLLGQTSGLTEGLTKTVLSAQLLNTVSVGKVELSSGVLLELLGLLIDIRNLGTAVVNHRLEHLINF